MIVFTFITESNFVDINIFKVPRIKINSLLSNVANCIYNYKQIVYIFSILKKCKLGVAYVIRHNILDFLKRPPYCHCHNVIPPPCYNCYTVTLQHPPLLKTQHCPIISIYKKITF